MDCLLNKYIVLLDKTPEPWEDYSVPIDVVECEPDEIEVLIKSKQDLKPEWCYSFNTIYEQYESEDVVKVINYENIQEN